MGPTINWPAISATAGSYFVDMRDRLGLVPFLAKRELSRRFAGSILGAAWAIALPALQVGIYWIVFALGLKLKSHGGASFTAVMIAGLVPWFAISDGLTGTNSAITANSQLVKRVAFPLELLPLANVAATLSVHSVIVVLATFLLWLMGYGPGWHFILIFYFAACLSILVFSVGVLLALANAAFRDVGQILNIALWLLFWLTPIVWPQSLLPASYRWALLVNPVAYIAHGYRAALIGPDIPIPSVGATAVFWTEMLFLSAAAFAAFRRFRQELADLL